MRNRNAGGDDHGYLAPRQIKHRLHCILCQRAICFGQRTMPCMIGQRAICFGVLVSCRLRTLPKKKRRQVTDAAFDAAQRGDDTWFKTVIWGRSGAGPISS